MKLNKEKKLKLMVLKMELINNNMPFKYKLIKNNLINQFLFNQFFLLFQ